LALWKNTIPYRELPKTGGVSNRKKSRTWKQTIKYRKIKCGKQAIVACSLIGATDRLTLFVGIFGILAPIRFLGLGFVIWD
jgi:hypothetical protein